ncbi:aromatic ring-hydroxylating oxygenase subunit alpha [Amycolatopsis jejuensis]|uniref:aromatic ring-hydroxylating oxygenase subunit alpha n=1 Tax=Amycolatopsis jejuensis TaxID=330084 RepID=UPI000B04D6E5|nr:Rieske 2Fe-2S domain-containing protein [Amycolatopsis jejuensis]
MLSDSGTLEVHSLVQQGRIHSEIFRSPAIYEAELRDIFDRTWVYLGHESQVANPGDYLTTTIGRKPIVLVRDEDGQVRAFFNRCRHRGSTVCRQGQGNAHYFRCPYHGWTYSNQGDLVGVPGPTRYQPPVDKPALGLVPIPRLETYRGLIFGSISPEVPSLPEHLGRAAGYLDRYFLFDGIRLTAGSNRHRFGGNWKFQLDGGPDGYHAISLHESFFAIQGKTPEKAHLAVSKRDAAGYSADLGNGHVLLCRRASDDLVERFRNRHPEYAEQVVQEHGLERLHDLLSQVNLIIFPNLYFAFGNVRVIHPVAANATDVEFFPLWLENAPDDVNAERLRQHEEGFPPGGFITPDDYEVYELIQKAIEADANPWMLLDRGMGQEEHTPDGEVRGDTTDELPQRAIYAHWARLMSGGADGEQ